MRGSTRTITTVGRRKLRMGGRGTIKALAAPGHQLRNRGHIFCDFGDNTSVNQIPSSMRLI